MSKARKVEVQDKVETPVISNLDIKEVIAAGKFSKEQREDVKACLMQIHREYALDLDNLSYYATKSQIIERLERIIAKAEQLQKALDDPAVKFELRKMRVLEFGVSDWEQSKRIWDLDRDITAPSRLKELAAEALRDPGSYAKASAEKPEDDNLVGNIWIAWQVLGRSAKSYYELQRDSAGAVSWQEIDEHFWANPCDEYRKSPAFRNFANRVVACFWPRSVCDREDRVGYLLKKLQRKFEDRRKDFAEACDTKEN